MRTRLRFFFALEVQLTTGEYRSFQVLSNIICEYGGVYLASVARHVCCGSFIFFGIIASLSCLHEKLEEDYLVPLAILLGFNLFVAGFVITVQESRLTHMLRIASSNRIQYYLDHSEGKYERLVVKSYRPDQVKFGWHLYTFNELQFLNFLQFLFDKVVIFVLVFC